MPRPTKQDPERGAARVRLLEAARDVIRRQGFAATSVDQLCVAAGVTKGAFFHHFKDKAALGVAAADFWGETTGAFFESAPYHLPADPFDRVLAYVAFRRSIIGDDLVDFTCLAGTLAQETYDSAPDIGAAAGRAIFGHAATLEADIAAAMQARGIDGDWTAASLARHTQVVLQGAFILAKAGHDPQMVHEGLDHLERYIRLLFQAA
jgi:TetR/AcrR family transcriptional repressor of nem operon